MKKLVYIALLRDIELSCDEVLICTEDKKRLETVVMDYFGISETKKYDKPAEYLGFTKIEYGEFEDDVEGYYKFKDEGEISRVFLISKVLE